MVLITVKQVFNFYFFIFFAGEEFNFFFFWAIHYRESNSQVGSLLHILGGLNFVFDHIRFDYAVSKLDRMKSFFLLWVLLNFYVWV